MSVHRVSAAAVLDGLVPWDTLIDARSPAEFALDALPGAVNWPSLDDQQRQEIGTLYKQVSPFEANKLGAAWVAANIAQHIQTHVLHKPRDWKPLIYCWRGGKRSGALALVLGQIGFRTAVVEGGYKAWRAGVVQQLPTLCESLAFRVLCGPTGSGKTRLLQTLHAMGEQVLDLEALAEHRSSVLGRIPGVEQPSQKRFETRVWQTLSCMDLNRPVYVESESRKVGDVAVPEPLILRMRAAPCVRMVLPDDRRVSLLLEDYPHLPMQSAWLKERLNALVALRGRQQVDQWQSLVEQGNWRVLVASLLSGHYDPGYQRSTSNAFPRSVGAPAIQMEGLGHADFERAARQTQAAFDGLSAAPR